jgi:carboxyl-terminal processing protease
VHNSEPGKKNTPAKWVFKFLVLAICAASVLTYTSLKSHGPVRTFDPSSPAYAQERGSGKYSPQELYLKAWGIIKDTFYDQKFNGQNWERWQHKYDGKLKTQEDSEKAIETMLYSLGDPYTRFLNAENFQDEKAQIQAHLFGVGMQLGMNKEHRVVVIAPIDNTPAYRAGMHSGDEIIEVNEKPVKGQSLDQVVKQIRGERGTKVSITFMRGLKKDSVSLVRDEIPIKSIVSCEMLPGDIGYIRLDSFISQKANEEMKAAINKLREKTDKHEAAKGLIIDLRYNPGGLLANAIDIANMFLDRGVIVSTIDADGYKTSQLATRTSFKTELPTVLLINKGSASASEIFSGALRDNGRAKLVGQTSFGKGLVQAINTLGNGTGVNVTIARYLTPNDTDIHKTGIVPDYDVKVSDDDLNTGKGPWWIDPTWTNFKRSPADGKDVQLGKALEVLKQQIAAAGQPTVATTDAPKKN